MDSANELSSELALAFLVEKKYTERLNSTDVLALIGKIKEVLQPLSAKEEGGKQLSSSEKIAKFISH